MTEKDKDAWDEDRQEDGRRARVGQLLLSSGRQHVTCYTTQRLLEMLSDIK